LRTAGGSRVSEAVTGGCISMTQGGPLTAWICLALPEHVTRNPVYRIGGMAEAIAGAGTGSHMRGSAGNDGSGPSMASSQEALPWACPNVPRHPGGSVVGIVAMVDLAIVDLMAFHLEFIQSPLAEYQLAAAPS